MEPNSTKDHLTDKLNRWLREITTELRELRAESKEASRAIRDESLRMWRDVAARAKQRIDRWVH